MPSPPSLSALKAAFGDTLHEVLKEAVSHSSESNKAAILEIALACPHLLDAARTPRSASYNATQTLLAGIYKLVCVIAAQDNIDVEDENGVDVRVILVAWSPDTHPSLPRSPYGPIVTLETLARSARAWQYAFGVESEAGEAMVQAFVTAKGSGEQVSNVQANQFADVVGSEHAEHPFGQPHHHVAVGGTFDHLHIGHKLLLAMTVFAVDDEANTNNHSERSATIGITGDQLLKSKKHAELLQSWNRRQKAVQDFVDSTVNFTAGPPSVTTRNDAGPNGKSVDFRYPNGLNIQCTEIQDPFGPTITEQRITALIISGETRSGGKAVNDKREEKGWDALQVFEVDVLDAEEGGEVGEGFQNKLSSSAIREKLAAIATSRM